MKALRFLVPILFILSSYSKCNESKESTTQLYKYKWWLTTLHNAGATEAVTQQKAFIRFDAAKNSAGGNAGCNVFGSTLMLSKDKLSVSKIFSTKMYCEQFQRMEDQFLGLLGTVNRYEIRDNSLLLYKDKELLLEFTGDASTE